MDNIGYWPCWINQRGNQSAGQDKFWLEEDKMLGPSAWPDWSCFMEQNVCTLHCLQRGQNRRRMIQVQVAFWITYKFFVIGRQWTVLRMTLEACKKDIWCMLASLLSLFGTERVWCRFLNMSAICWHLRQFERESELLFWWDYTIIFGDY
jgi:hypothetical protein